jgi:hypothetical protein
MRNHTKPNTEMSATEKMTLRRRAAGNAIPSILGNQQVKLPKQEFNRVVLELPEALVHRIDTEIMPAIGYKTRCAFISSAIEFYIWAIQQVVNGAAVGAMTHDSEEQGVIFRTNETAGLENLKRWLDKRPDPRAVSAAS